MTATRDPDRLLRAWLDLMPDEAPDRVIDAVLLATTAAPQARRFPWHGRWRPNQMNRLVLIAAAALVLAGLVGGAVYFGSTRNPLPTPGPTAVPTPSPGPTARAPIVPPPQTTWGDWLADVPAIPEIDTPAGMLQLSVDWEAGQRVWLQTTPDYRQLLNSAPLSAPNGELRLRSNTVDNVYCTVNDEGSYRWNRSSDGLFLTLQLIADDCPARAAVFARTWVRSHGAVNDGGPGVNYGVTPMIQMTLPTGQRYGMGGGEQGPDIGTFGDQLPYRAFVVIRNPGGFGAPCAATDTQKIDVAHTTAAFAAYLDALPGVNLTTSDTTIGGRSAVRMDVAVDPGVKCRAGGNISAFHVEKLTDEAFWELGAGQVETFYIVQIDATTTFLLWYQGTAAEETAVLDSITFIDKLPTP